MYSSVKPPPLMFFDLSDITYSYNIIPDPQPVWYALHMGFVSKWRYYSPSPFLRVVQISLLALILIGVGLLFTQKMWVPRLVEFLLRNETQTKIVAADVTTPATKYVSPGTLNQTVEFNGLIFSYPSSWQASRQSSGKGTVLYIDSPGVGSEPSFIRFSVNMDSLSNRGSPGNAFEFADQYYSNFGLVRKSDIYLKNFATSSRMYENVNFTENFGDKNPDRSYLIPLNNDVLSISIMNYNPLLEPKGKTFNIDERLITNFLSSIIFKNGSRTLIPKIN